MYRAGESERVDEKTGKIELGQQKNNRGKSHPNDLRFLHRYSVLEKIVTQGTETRSKVRGSLRTERGGEISKCWGRGGKEIRDSLSAGVTPNINCRCMWGNYGKMYDVKL